ncbi:MAG: M24 family metallopeptidase [Pseudonocardiaceae bacterium]|nr:M24 family metallopeptidase [Pseudonocardiaceae bacterium]
MDEPHVHFTRAEFADRQARMRQTLVEHELDGMLLFTIEDMYWLCGLDTDGFCIFHCMFIGTEGQLTHLTRNSDLANVRYSSICQDVRICRDGNDVSRPEEIKQLLHSHGMRGRRIGIQLDTKGLTPQLYLELRETLDGWCRLVDASNLVGTLRLVKSPQELAYIRKAGDILDTVREVAVGAAKPGLSKADIYGLVYQAAFASGGDPPAHRPPIGCADASLNTRYTTGNQWLAENDHMTFELGVGYRHYHAGNFFVVLTGPDIDSRQLAMHRAAVEALDNVQDTMRPGRTFGDLFDVHRATLAEQGYGHAALSACGYTMGAVWPPTWMEKPQIVRGNPTVLEPNMTIFAHMILVDRDNGLMMGLGEQAIVTENGGPEIVTHVPREPVANS